jgi:hypothetical protein
MNFRLSGLKADREMEKAVFFANKKYQELPVF